MFVAIAVCLGFYRCSAPEYQHDRVLMLRCAAPGFFNFHHFAILFEPAAAPLNVCSNCRLPNFLKVQCAGISGFRILRCYAPFGVVWLHGFYKHYRCAAPFNQLINSILQTLQVRCTWIFQLPISKETAAAPRNVCSNCRLPGFLKVQYTGISGFLTLRC